MLDMRFQDKNIPKVSKCLFVEIIHEQLRYIQYIHICMYMIWLSS